VEMCIFAWGNVRETWNLLRFVATKKQKKSLAALFL